MSDLAVVMLHVDDESCSAMADERFPVFHFDPAQGASWEDVSERIRQAGVRKVLLQFSNETIAIPEHGWSCIDWEYRSYRRLYAAEEIAAYDSVLACIELQPSHSLPGWHIETREMKDSGDGRTVARLLHAFDARNWAEAASLLDGEPIGTEAAALFARSCLYDRTNRFEEAYETSLRALSQDANGCDMARLWLAHGLHAAKCGRPKEAEAAFRMSDAERRHMEPLYCWADELMRGGAEGEETTSPIEGWLANAPDKEERMIRLLHRLGRYEDVLSRLGQREADASDLARVRFDCLIRAGRHGEAVLLFREQSDDYKVRHLTDALLCAALLAGDDMAACVGSLAPHELDALLDRAVELRLMALAEKLQPFADNPLAFAFKLYSRGYVMRSATYWLDALRAGTLDRDGFRCLGEILYYRRAYDQAAEMFEYLLAQTPEDASLRTLLALACLRQSEKLLGESRHLFPSSVFLREEAEKVAAGIARMEQSGALTRWRLSERGNFHG